MKCLRARSGVKALVAAGLGLVAGGVVGQVADRLAFRKATMYETMFRLHNDTRKDFVFANRSESGVKTFELTPGTPAKLIGAAAKQFGKEGVEVASIMVLEDTLPDAATAMDKIKGMESYLANTFPPGSEERDPFSAFDFAVTGEAKAMAKGLGSGTWTFGSLPPGEQQRTLDLMRAAQYQLPASLLGSMLLQYQQATHPEKYR